MAARDDHRVAVVSRLDTFAVELLCSCSWKHRLEDAPDVRTVAVEARRHLAGVGRRPDDLPRLESAAGRKGNPDPPSSGPTGPV